MKIKFILFLLLILIAEFPANAYWQSRNQIAVNTVAYVGLGNVVSGASFYVGLRAYSAATAGNKAINICNVSDIACADWFTNASGDLVPTTVGGTDCVASSGVCTIKTWYDQTGSTNCGGVACDFSQTTLIANRATFISAGNCPSALSVSRPCAFFTTTTPNCYIGAGTLSVTLPFAISAVLYQNSTLSDYQTVLADEPGGNFGMYYRNSGNIDLYWNADHNATAATSTWHAVQGIVTGSASSSLNIDGSATSFTTVNTNFSAVPIMGSYGSTTGCPNQSFNGYLFEMAVYPSNLSGNISALNSNQHAYGGF